MFYIVLAVLALTFASCEADVSFFNEEKPFTQKGGICINSTNAICFFYETLDTTGKPKTAFEEGENFMLSFRIENNTDQDIVVHDLPIFAPGYMEVFRRDGTKVASLGGVYTLQRGTTVFKNANLSINIQYYQDSTETERTILVNGVSTYVGQALKPQPHLPSGQYFSGFTSKFIIYVGSQEEKIEKEITAKAEFDIQ